MNVDFHELASFELDDAFEYYEYQQQNLGYRFIAEVQNTVERIKHYPMAWHIFSNSTRRCLVKNFPYGVIYQKLEDNSIFIVAIMNLHRKPNYWIDRLK